MPPITPGAGLKDNAMLSNEPKQFPKEISRDIWKDVLENSFVMQHGTKVDMPAGGKEFMWIASDPTAAWVAEGGRKPNGKFTFDNTSFSPYKAALTVSFSDEFKRDRAAMYNAVKPRIATALTNLFDLAVLHGVDVPGVGFSHLGGAPVQAFDGSYDAAVATLKKAAAAKGTITGWGLSALAEVSLYEQKDTTGRPLYVPNINSAANTGSILGKPVYIADHLAYSSTTAADTVGIAGNWSEIMWGYVEGISYEEYDGPIFAQNGTLIHAGRQDNMSTLIVEFEVGSLIRKPNQFVRLVEDNPGTAGLQPETADTP